MRKAEIGIVGLGVMGRMLAYNAERNGFRVAGYDIDAEQVQNFRDGNPEGDIVGTTDVEAFIASLERPRKIMMMVTAGAPVDAVIKGLLPHLEGGDLLIDGGNSHFQRTEQRAEQLEARGVLFMGVGVSGGEYGALWGPSIMPGGPEEGWEHVKPLFETIAAQVGGEPCVAYLGPGGAGHYVKMVHNGIEYAVMQLIAEVYDLLHRGLGLSTDELHDVFAAWNDGILSSFLVEITAAIFKTMDESVGRALVDVILDRAKQKGTGRWTAQNALELGASTPTINAAVDARIISSYKVERVAAAEILSGPGYSFEAEREPFINMARDALYAAMLCTYAQGFALMREANKEYGYGIDHGTVARIWRGGCIIRAQFLEEIRAAFERKPELKNLLIDETVGGAVAERQEALRTLVQRAVEQGIPVPALCTTIAYYDAYRSERLPANLIQAQRDYFGAHTYQRVDEEGIFHTKWFDVSQQQE